MAAVKKNSSKAAGERKADRMEKDCRGEIEKLEIRILSEAKSRRAGDESNCFAEIVSFPLAL
jgi:hypothetical protein